MHSESAFMIIQVSHSFHCKTWSFRTTYLQVIRSRPGITLAQNFWVTSSLPLGNLELRLNKPSDCRLHVAAVLTCYCNVCETLICKLVYLFIVFGEHGSYIGNINHLWWWASFSPTGVVCVWVGPRYKWWPVWGMMSTAGLELPYPRISQAKFRDETFRRGK